RARADRRGHGAVGAPRPQRRAARERRPVSDKRYYMACLDLTGRSCLVVGGGRVGTEKAEGLLECGARVTVVAPEIRPELAALDVETVERRYQASDLDERFLVVAATASHDVNRRVWADA